MTTVKTNKLTFIGFFINAAAGSGRYDHITIDRVRQEIERGTIFELLKAELGRDIDLSLVSEAERAELVEEWQRIDNVAHRGNILVDRGGLNLLMAYLLEGIQLRQPK